MNASMIITPEVIFHKLFERLKGKTADLEYLAFSNKSFEKWLQCELLLSMSNIALPTVYDDKLKEITYEGSSEQVCDTTIEYTISDIGERLVSDFMVAESPFLTLYANEDWQVGKNDIKKCQEHYYNTKFHYVELKQHNWADISNESHIEKIVNELEGDFRKYRDLRRKTLTQYFPRSVVLICCLGLYDSSQEDHNPSRQDIKTRLEKVANRVLNGSAEYQKDGTYLWVQITNHICLLMVYYNMK